MATPTVLPGRKKPFLAGLLDGRRLTRPQLSWIVLVATGFVIALVLLVWLLLWISRPKTQIEGWWIAQRGLATPALGHQANDLRKILKASAPPPRDAGYQGLEQALRNRLAGSGTRSIVVYLSAAGVSDPGGAFLLRPEPGALLASTSSAPRDPLIRVETLVDLFDEAPSRKKLLILDAGQVGSDRDLGVFANGFVARLKRHLEGRPVKGLAVLCSCAPGQTSWTSEADRRSAFGYFVAEALAGKATGWDPSAAGLTVHALHRYVRQHVERWASANRQAVQTPELLGDPSVNFTLPRSAPARNTVPTAADKDAERVQARLGEAWASRDALQARRPYRHSPLLWQQYLETLLRAERLFRFGDHAEAEELVGGLSSLEKRIADASGGLPWGSFRSIAQIERRLADLPSEALRKAEKAGNDGLDAALKELTDDVEAVEEPPPDASPKPAVPATPPSSSTSTVPRPPAEAPGLSTSAPVPKKKKARPRGDSALASLVFREEGNRPLYVEAQPLVWADAFVRGSGAPYSFKGKRGDLLEDALRTRRLAERAAAPDDRVRRWVVPLVDSGDALRRLAQDGLFAGDSGQLEALTQPLDQARTRYREAQEVGEQAAKAGDLVEQLESELPFYGEWQATVGRRGGAGLDPEFVDLLRATAILARQLQGDASGASGGPSSSRRGDDPLSGHRELVRRWREQARDVLAAFEHLQADFQARCAALSASGGAGRWREIDGVLAVPLIPAEVRRQLLARVRSAASASALAGPESEAPSTGAESAPTDVTGLAKKQTQDVLAANKSVDREAASEASTAADAPTSPDPEFWKNALGLARLEWGLLEIGGGAEAGLERLEDAFGAAQEAAKGDPGPAFEAFASLSEQIRNLRAGRLKAIGQARGPAFAPLAEAARALRVLPLADALGLTDRPIESLDRHHRQALLVWQGRRVLEDFAPDHARRYFEDAQQSLDTEEVRAALADAEAMSQAALSLSTEPARPIAVKEWTEQAVSVALAAVGPVPPGDPVVLVGYNPSLPLGVTEKSRHHDSREGVPIALRPDQAHAPIAYAVSRTESTREPILTRLNPIAFYRGRTFPSARGVEVTVDPARDPISVTIQQAYEGLKFKDFTDQFKEHPGQGYLHYGTNLQYKLVLTADRPLKVVVHYGLKEHPESSKTTTLDLTPRKRGEVVGAIKGDDFPIVKAEELLNVAPLTLMVTVRKEKEDGEVLGKGKYTFRMIPPSQYIATAASFDETQRILYVYATHLATDPVTGPVEILASIGGSIERGWVRRSRIAWFAFRVPPTVKSVKWRVGVESMPSAFVEEIETPIPPALAAPPPAQ